MRLAEWGLVGAVEGFHGDGGGRRDVGTFHNLLQGGPHYAAVGLEANITFRL